MATIGAILCRVREMSWSVWEASGRCCAHDHLHMLTSSSTRLGGTILALPPFDLCARLPKGPSRTEFSVICQLARNKETIVAGPTICNLHKHWKAAASEADILVIIGVSHNPHDWHVNSAVEKARAVLYVGSRDEAAKWQAVNHSVDYIGARFADDLPDLLRCVEAGRERC
jgi:hypothetical protein